MKSVSHSKSLMIEQSIDKLFPLFSPEGEKLWVPDWDYHNVMDSTTLAEDFVFLTDTHNHASAQAIWIVKRFDPAIHLVQYYKIEPGDKVGLITVKCLEKGPQLTEVRVTYKYIALSTSGEKFISGFTENNFTSFIEYWRELLVKYFQSFD